MNQNLVKRESISQCRICKDSNLKKIITLPKMPFTDQFLKHEELRSEFLADIEIAVCRTCGSTQNINNTDMGDYYFDYTYTVQSSNFAVNFMRTLATRIKKNYLNNIKNPKIIDIGSGSGEQLLEFKNLGFDVLGIDPSEKLSKYANSIGVKTLTAFFDENTKKMVDKNFEIVDAMVTSYTFDHIPQINEVLKNIYRTLKMNGLLIIEVHDLELIRKRNEFCLFEHEHYTYLNKTTITQLLNQNQFKVLTFDLLSKKEKRGNSLLVVAQKVSNLKLEKINVKTEISKLVNLDNEIKSSIKRIDNWLWENRHLKIAAYGAGGRGVMTIAALKNSNIFRYIVDKNPKSSNIYTPKSHLPVYNIEELEKNPVDKILIFSFGYYEEIINELSSRFSYKPDQCINILTLLSLKDE
jgi:ubiquinone/menaquinone biosynthesis C-methylase UbiE